MSDENEVQNVEEYLQEQHEMTELENHNQRGQWWADRANEVTLDDIVTIEVKVHLGDDPSSDWFEIMVAGDTRDEIKDGDLHDLGDRAIQVVRRKWGKYAGPKDTA